MRVLCPVLTASLFLVLAGCSPSQDDAAAADTADAGSTTPPASAPPPPETGPSPRIMHYDCEGTLVDASFDGQGQVSIAVDGSTFLLRTEDGAQGTKYVDEAGNQLWTRSQDSALLMRPGHPERTCAGNEAAPA